MSLPNRHASVAQMLRTPRRSYYSGRRLDRVQAIADLRAHTHRLMPRIALEYFEGGAGEEGTLLREAFAERRFMPHTLVDESHRDIAVDILGRKASMPMIVAPTGLNGIFMRHADGSRVLQTRVRTDDAAFTVADLMISALMESAIG